MTARTHDLAAITALGIVMLLSASTKTFTLSTLIIAVLANQIGGIVPDIDQPTAPFWRNLPIGSFFGKIFGKLLGGHRFLTHSILGLILFNYIVKFVLHFLHPLMPKVDTHFVWAAFMVGMISHLFMDTFTKEGVPWLLPVPIKFGLPPLKKMRITTGKWTEKVLFMSILAADIWFVTSHYATILNLFHKHIV